MQETGLVLQEFARMNGLQSPNYPPYMFRQTLTHKVEGVNLEEEGAAQEYLRIEDEYEVAFQPQFSRSSPYLPLHLILLETSYFLLLQKSQVLW